MEPKVNYLLVGAFVALLGLATLVGILWMGKADYRGTYERYATYMRESVAGLSVDSTVKYRGVDVGRVKEIALNPENPEEVRLLLDIAKGTPIKTDTIAVLQTQGLTGLATVNLTGGSRDAPPLQPTGGQEYPVIQAGPSLFFRLDEALSRLLSEKGLTTLLADLDVAAKGVAGLADDENRQRLKQALQDLAEVSQAVAAHKGQLESGVAEAARSAEQLSQVTQVLAEQAPLLLARLNKSAVAIQRMTDELTETSQAVGHLVQEAQPEITQFSRQTVPDAGRLVREMRELTGSMNRLVQSLERDPSALVVGKPVPKRGPGE